jgi:CBS domain-containing protein
MSRSEGSREESMKVSELMSKDVASVRSDEPLSAPARLMWDCDCGAVPVIEASGDRVVGMITDRDICMACWSRDCPPSGIRVSDAMSRQLHHCAPEDTLTSAERLMRSQQVRRLPVLDPERRLLGILSLADIARQSQGGNGRKLGPDLAPEEVASTLAGISERPPPATAGRNA